MIVVYKNGVAETKLDENDYPAIAATIDRVQGGVVGIVFRDTEGNLTSYVKEEDNEG